MSTVYSLVCFGGRSGKTATMTIASPCVVTLANHGLRNGAGVQFSTTGTLPTGIVPGTNYYIYSTGTNTFNLYDTYANAIAGGSTGRVNTSGTQSGTHTIFGKYFKDLTSGQLARYGSVGSERIYDSLSTWVSGRSGAPSLDYEICELGEAFTDIVSTVVNVNVPAGAIKIESRVNGVRSTAYHNGGLSIGTNYAGYVLFSTNPAANILALTTTRTTVDGFTVRIDSTGYSPNGVAVQSLSSKAINMIAIGSGTANGGGFNISGTSTETVNCLAIKWATGFNIAANVSGLLISNCLATKNNTGFYAVNYNPTYGYYYNNISVGNVTTNWATGVYGFTAATKNAGLTTEAWINVTGSRITIATSDFVSWGTSTPASTDDFRPALSTSPQTDTGVQFYGAYTYDIKDSVRPNYNNGGSTAFDVGIYEYDNGFGLAPENLLTINNLLSGSTVYIYTTGTQTVLASTTNSSTSYSPTGLSGTVDYTIYKDGYIPIRVTGVTLTSGVNLSVDGTQTLDRAYQTSSGLTYGTTATINTSTKIFTVGTATTGQNWYSFWIEQFRSNSALRNIAFPLQANGPNSFTLKDGYEFDNSTSIAYITRDGIRYTNTSGTRTASWAAILTVGAPAGSTVRYQQSDGGTTVSNGTTGEMDKLIQIYGDLTHGNFDYTNYLILKIQKSGYDQAETNVINLYGTLEDQLYVVALSPIANGVATGNPSLTSAPTITDHGASPVTWNSKVFSITITDSATGNTGQNIMRWLRYYFETGGTFQGKDAFNWHDLVQTNSSSYKTVRGYIYGDTGATLKGVRVVQNDGVTPHSDFSIMTADDGTTYTPGVYQRVTITGLTANSRVQIYDNTSSTELYNAVVAGTSLIWTDTAVASASRSIRLRVAYCTASTANQFLDQTIGTCGITSTDNALSYLYTPVTNNVYVANMIDGTTITDCSISGTSLRVNINAGSTTWQHVYAFMTYWLYTSGGIRDQYLEMTATDQTNYTFMTAHGSFKIKNITSPAVPLLITGGNASPDSGAVTDILDTTGGTIFCIEKTVVPFTYSTGSGLSAAEHNKLFSIPQDVWDTPSSALTTSGSVGNLVKNNVPLIPASV